MKRVRPDLVQRGLLLGLVLQLSCLVQGVGVPEDSGDCFSGYVHLEDQCVDINECLESLSSCDPRATCTNTEGSYICTCPDGFIGDGTVCSEQNFTEVSACAPNICGQNALCSETNPPSRCICRQGFEGNGVTCLDIDECGEGLHNCSENAVCTNSDGSYQCACRVGFEGDGLSCNPKPSTSVPSCEPGACASNATCSLRGDQFFCQCNQGFRGDGLTCFDENECQSPNACPQNARCTNSFGHYSCECRSGFQSNGVSCLDIDECLAGTHICEANATCVNTSGRFNCVCPEGYTSAGASCLDIDECAFNLDTCGAGAVCANTPGSFTCACRPGYESDGLTCLNINECARNLDDCLPEATCTDIPGSYTCTCPEDTVGDGRACQEQGEFTIDLVYTRPVAANIQNAFEAAKVRWEEIILGDLPDVPVSQACSALPSRLALPNPNTVDDLVISVTIEPNDGPGGILGAAGPVCTRNHNGLRVPYVGDMTFDEDDILGLLQDNQLQNVILHEMGHVLGIGTLWDDYLVNPSCNRGGCDTSGRQDTRFRGPEALIAWRQLGGTEPDIPIENVLGPGSSDGHWREFVSAPTNGRPQLGPLGLELMSPILSRTNFLSILTIRALVDLGYEVANNSVADNYSVSNLSILSNIISEQKTVEMVHDIITTPIEHLE